MHCKSGADRAGLAAGLGILFEGGTAARCAAPAVLALRPFQPLAHRHSGRVLHALRRRWRRAECRSWTGCATDYDEARAARDVPRQRPVQLHQRPGAGAGVVVRPVPVLSEASCAVSDELQIASVVTTQTSVSPPVTTIVSVPRLQARVQRGVGPGRVGSLGEHVGRRYEADEFRDQLDHVGAEVRGRHLAPALHVPASRLRHVARQLIEPGRGVAVGRRAPVAARGERAARRPLWGRSAWRSA